MNADTNIRVITIKEATEKGYRVLENGQVFEGQIYRGVIENVS